MAETPPGACVLICRACEDDDPLVMPFISRAERGRWAAEHTRGTGHYAWFCLDGWPAPAQVIAEMRRLDEWTAELRRAARAAVSAPTTDTEDERA